MKGYREIIKEIGRGGREGERGMQKKCRERKRIKALDLKCTM